jgi:hypothetical protein
LVVATIIAVVVGVVVSNNNKKASSALGSGSSGGSSGSSSDPSNFQKDSRLIPSLYGIAYTPEGSILPNCGANLGELILLRHILISYSLISGQVITDVQVRVGSKADFLLFST